MGGLIATIDSDNGDENQMFEVPVEEIGSFSVGNEVTITIKGCVGMAQIPPEAGYGKPQIGVKVYSQDIRKTGNAQIEEIRAFVEGDVTDGEDY